jgi:acyl-CoA thioesterase-1
LLPGFIAIAAHDVRARSSQSAAEACLAVNQQLSAVMRRFRAPPLPCRAGGPLKIVAMGSSSTLGLWQSDPAKTYPGMLQSEMQRSSNPGPAAGGR